VIGMAGFLVTVPFTRNGVAGTAVVGVGASFAANVLAAVTFAEGFAEAYIQKNPADVVVFGTVTAVASGAIPT
jgi:hypothetical protein